MRSPALSDLPPPPPGKSAWPWTVESPRVPDVMPDGAPWPQVCIVTPSYNQADFIEETIRSVLLQGYPRLEYIVIDGGSTDGSVDIIRKYQEWLTYWVCEPDKGQVHAIDKGWAKGAGSILAYLNSDDTYLLGAVPAAAWALTSRPEAVAVCGGELQIDRDGWVVAERIPRWISLHGLRRLHFIPQPAVLLRRSALEEVGGLDLTFQLVFDYELWTRLARRGSFHCIPQILAATRLHQNTKTHSQRPQIAVELQRVIAKVLTFRDAQIGLLERRIIQSRLSYILASIYLDDPVRYHREIIAQSFRSLLSWPPTLPDLVRLVAFRFAPVTLTAHLRLASRRLRRDWQVDPGTTKVHWSVWQSPQQASPTAQGG